MTTEQLPVGDPQPQRRIAVVPLAVAGVVVVLAIVFTVIVVALATSSAPPTPPADGAPPVPASTEPAPVPSQAEAPEPRRDPEQNECVDELGDSELDVDAARVEVDDGRLVTHIDLASAIPGGEVTLGIFAVAGNGDQILQLATAFDDGEVDEAYVTSYGVAEDYGKGDKHGKNDDPVTTDSLGDDDVDVSGSEITVEFPKEVLRQLGNRWSWYAFATIDGAEVDACPGAVQSFDTQSFDAQPSDPHRSEGERNGR